jgi:hypothetical protein
LVNEIFQLKAKVSIRYIMVAPKRSSSSYAIIKKPDSKDFRLFLIATLEFTLILISEVLII